MTNLKALIPILLALLIAVGGSYFLYNWVKEKSAPQKEVVVKESKAVPVVVAKVPIQWGVTITPEMVEVRSFLENSLPKGYFKKVSDVTDRVVTSHLTEGDAVVEHRLAPTTIETGGVAAVLETGMRAISVAGNNVLGIAGFINPGNRIDVLLTVNDPAKGEQITKIVLENLHVLASGRQIRENKKGEAAPVDVYTLEVTPEQGERLTLAANKGRLQFALRGAVDTDFVFTKGATLPELLSSYVLTSGQPQVVKTEPASEKGKPDTKPVQKTYIPPEQKGKIEIEIIKGMARQKKEFTL